MTSKVQEQLKNLFANDFFTCFLFLVGYLCTNSYIYGWDNQHLEIPLLKHLIDPSLYKGDYYVESLANNFSSYLYPIMARFITVAQVPAAYLILFLIFRYFLFYFMYKLWQLLCKDRFTAVCAILMYMVLGRTEELLWRTFSHEIVGECLMFAGIYLFYRERFMPAALVFGLAANIHGIYNLFAMLYMLVFLLVYHARRWEMAFKTGLVFIAGSLPFLCWQIPRSLHEKLAQSVPISEWLPLYYVSCPQNFLFGGVPLQEALADKSLLLECIGPYVFLAVVYVFLLFVYPPFRQDRKTNVLIWTSFALIVFSTFFTYTVPSRFVLDLNLLRNEQLARLFLMAYTTFWAVKAVQEAAPWRALAAAVTFLFIGFGNRFSTSIKLKENIAALLAMVVVAVVLNFKRLPKLDIYLRRAFIIIPIVASSVFLGIFNYNYVQAKNNGDGPWQLLRNWDDMQYYVRDHTPKDALILTPIDVAFGGFRIKSERKVVVCKRDCGIIGFDYGASVEWQKRMDDLKDFVMLATQSVKPSVFMALTKYRVDYIVFMKYYQPQEDNRIFKRIYQNEVFSLYQVLVHPSGGAG